MPATANACSLSRPKKTLLVINCNCGNMEAVAIGIANFNIWRYPIATCNLITLHNMALKKSVFYSVFRLFAGLVVMVFVAWLQIVTIDTRIITKPLKAKIHSLISIL